jgi:5-methylcytosine-specific restriction endonuclease McrA
LASALSCFLRPRPVKITGRTSSVTNAFVNGIIPCIPPTEAEVQEVLDILALDAADLRCAYCGDVSTEWDHLRPLIADKRPTGFITEIANLVPACGKCNQSKSGAEWRKWMTGTAKRSPASRGIPDLQARLERLGRFEKWREPRVCKFEDVMGTDLWARHWANWKQLIALMHECEHTAKEIRQAITRAAEA